MQRLSPFNQSAAATILCLAIVVVEGWGLRESRRVADRALAGLEQKKQERAWLASQSPALSSENESAISSDLAGANRLLGEIREALRGKDPKLLAVSAPAKPIDAYFELAGFVEKLRSRAAQAQVVIKPDERFGFSTHTHEGPAAEQLAAVHRQRLATQYLVELLLESRPFALLAVRRERPVADAPRDTRERTEDFFELDRPLSLRQPGQVESLAFRLEFTGQTATLRNLLNSLAAFRQSVVVRSVEVEPLAAAGPNTPAPAAGSPVPLVSNGLSKLAVTVEFVLLTANPVTTAP